MLLHFRRNRFYAGRSFLFDPIQKGGSMKFKLVNIIVLIAMVFSLCLSIQPAKAQSQADDPGEFVPGEVVVGFKSAQSVSQTAALAASAADAVHAMVVNVGDRGVALLRTDENADPQALAETLKESPDVAFAEPNYIYRIPPTENLLAGKNYLQQQYVLKRLPDNSPMGKDFWAIPIAYLQAMKSGNGKTQSTNPIYPNDPYLWWNGGWSVVGADVVAPNTTPSAGVCVLDTGVDYTHPDLAGRVIKGFDYVNNDSDPMDDYGHGTHVTGIITAVANNKKGMAGASNAKVVAVKVLGSQGWGTNFDIAQGINFCANRSDVKVLNMSLGGSDYSDDIYDAIDYAVNTKGKMVVASAGNRNTSVPSYPAYMASYAEFTDKVLAVAASGLPVDDGNGYYNDYWCKASYSNYGSWVSVIAPGTDIYSTTPWDKPFYANYYYGYQGRYDYMGGTSMAAPFVAAAAARRWGYKPLELNAQVGSEVINSGWQAWDYHGDGSCWPASMVGKHVIDIPTLLDRFAFNGGVIDASTGLPLVGAAVQAYLGTSLKGSTTIVPSTYTDCCSTTDPDRIYTDYTRFVNVINLPRTGTLEDTFYDYTLKVSRSGYTASPQAVWQHDDLWENNGNDSNTIYMWDTAAVPPSSNNFEVTMGFTEGYYYDSSVFDLALDVWLPDDPNPLDPGQPASFIVGWYEGDDFGFREGDPSGAMSAFPFARYKREGGVEDSMPWENTTISARLAHAPLAANTALPYYPGDYVIGVTDYGTTYDHDEDAGTPAIPAMGTAAVPYVYIWKNGVIKLFNMMGYQDPGDTCNAHWWKAATITSGKTGAATYTPEFDCGNRSIMPY
jgi:subtilisin family serine protease